MKAVIFDCDGVLADTERYGHLPAFNQMFRELGVPIHWSEEEYGHKLSIGGGKERMASELTPGFVRANGLPTDPQDQAALIAAWHKRKTEIYIGMVAAGKLPPRAGVARITRELQDDGWKLAVASTSAESSVRAILDAAVGPDRAARFDRVLAGDCVPHKKPAPDIYLLALEELRVDHSRALVVEDSHNGLIAACGAGLRCLVTVNDYTRDEDFAHATLVVTSLGDPGGEKTVVLANRSPASPGEYVTKLDMEACLRADGQAGPRKGGEADGPDDP
jgi:HAD superfamily hydrolase (TIGR01509 family)